MATTANHDVPLTLTVDTVGAESIKQLSADVSALGKQGADAVPEFAKLATEINRLADQSALVGTMRELTTQVDELGAAQSQAAATTATLKTQFDELHSKTQAASTIQATLKKSLFDARQQLSENRQAMSELDKTTDQYTSRSAELADAISKGRTSIREMVGELRAAGETTKIAAAEEATLAKQFTASSEASRTATAKLSERNAALVEAKTALQQMGAATDTVTAADADLIASFVKVATSVNDVRDALRTKQAAEQEMLESDRLLAIEQRGLAELFERGRVALIAEETAIREAARASQAYTQARQEEATARAVAEAKWKSEADAIVEGVEAKQRMLRETQNLVEAYQFMAQEDAAAKWQKEAFAIVEAAEATQRLNREARLLAEAEEFLANEATLAAAGLQKIEGAAKDAGDAIERALGDVGVRSAADIRAEITKVRSAMDLLKSSGTMVGAELDAAFAKGGSKIKALERDLREVNGALTMGDKAAKLFSGSLAQISAGNMVADGVGYLVNKVKELGQAFLDAIVQGDQMRRGLNAIYKDTELATRQMEFLRKASSESGVSFNSLSGEFVRFSASMKSANVPLEQSNNLFKAVTAATASLGLGAEATAGTLNALGQMASKGVVSMEELRQQLGDRLPGALGLAAKGLGITEAELVKLVESGKLATRDFIVPFTNALGEMKAETDGIIPTWERFKGLLAQVAQGMGDAGGTLILTGALKVLGGTVAALSLGLSSVVESLLLVGSGVTALAARLSGDTKAWEFFSDQVEKARVRLTGQADAFNTMLDPAAAAAAATNNVAVAMTANTAAATKAIVANAGLGAEQKLLALSVALAGDATLDASAKIVQFNVAAEQLIKAQAGQTEAFGKTAKAAKEQGDTLVTLAKLTGDETAIRQASIQAAEMHAAALEKLAQSQASETVMLQAQKRELEASAKQRGLTSQQIKVEIDALDALIKKSEAETEQARQSSEAAKTQVLERKLLGAAIADNSAKVGELKAAMQSAAITLQEYERLAINGKKTEQEVLAARVELTRVTSLYNDALKDTVTALNAKQITEKANAEITQIGLNTQKLYYQSMLDTAKATGDYNLALYATVEQKKIDIKIIEAKVIAMKAEADGAIAVAKAELAVLDASGKLDPVRRAQIDASIKMAEAKKLEAEAVGLSVNKLDAEIAALREGRTQLDGFTNSSKTAANGQRDFANATDTATAALEAKNAAQERANNAIEKAIELENKRRNVDKEGYSLNTAGERVSMDGQTQRSVYETAKGQGLTETQALKISNQFISNGQKVAPDGFDASAGENWGTALQKAINKIVLDNAQSKSYEDQGLSANGSRSPNTSPNSSKTTSTANTVNINIGGVTTPVNVASASDARNLQSVLTQLANAQGRSI